MIGSARRIQISDIGTLASAAAWMLNIAFASPAEGQRLLTGLYFVLGFGVGWVVFGYAYRRPLDDGMSRSRRRERFLGWAAPVAFHLLAVGVPVSTVGIILIWNEAFDPVDATFGWMLGAYVALRRAYGSAHLSAVPIH